MGSEKRKLQSEIERCVKKIQEGVDEFDTIWAKVQEATNANQKEKFETDLKKEIKKLQRLREQVKNWIASSDIKDKSQLQEYRKMIELKMEQFKVVERETKTKAYSKQGLGAEQKLDPKEKEKEETIGWLQESIDRLSLQGDKFEAEIEHISAGGGKKKKLDKDRQERLDELKRHLERHRYHMQKLELLMRLVTNSSLESVQVVKIHDDLEYYIANNQEQDFEENEFMYDDLNLGDVELAQQLGAMGLNQEDGENSETNTTTSVSPSASPAPSLNSKDSSNRENEEGKLRHVSEGVEEISKPIASRIVPLTVSRSTPTTPLKLTSQLSLDSSLSTPPSTGTPPLATGGASSGMSYNSVVAAGAKSSAIKASAILSRTTASASFDAKPAVVASRASAAAVVIASVTSLAIEQSPSSSNQYYQGSATVSAQQQQQQGQSPSPAAQTSQQTTNARSTTPSSNSSNAAKVTTNDESKNQAVMNGPSPSNETKKPDEAQSKAGQSDNRISSINLGPSSTAITSPNLTVTSAVTTVVSGSASSSSSASNVPPLLPGNMLPPGQVNASVLMGYNALNTANQLQQQQQQQKTQDAHIPPLLGASPLGKIIVTQDHSFQLNTLDHAIRHPPIPADSERLRTYLPRSPCQVPPHYPQAPPPMSDVLEYFNHLQPETLFFIFYYLEGTKAQYLAARALKRQSWRFHTKYMMWFQRHEEPKTITEEFEQGTYIYFDFEKWSQRKKEGFTFEYRYLEDKELS